MRELRFRAWDTSDKDKGPYMLGPYDLTDAIFSHTEIRKMPLMQFTGLKDKNGKEIYEGDIVQRGVILFGNGKFQGYYYESNGGIAEAWEDDLCQERNIEVLGNMYENPELMKSDF